MSRHLIDKFQLSVCQRFQNHDGSWIKGEAGNWFGKWDDGIWEVFDHEPETQQSESDGVGNHVAGITGVPDSCVPGMHD